MCRYCDFSGNRCGNVLLSKEVNLGDFGLADMGIELWEPNVLWLSFTPVNIDAEISTNMSIKYCPMCGRKLTDDED